MGVADEIFKAKTLLDEGAITKAEFDRIKARAINAASPTARKGIRAANIVGAVLLLAVCAALGWSTRTEYDQPDTAPRAASSRMSGIDWRQNADGSVYSPQLWSTSNKDCIERLRSVIAPDDWDMRDGDSGTFILPRKTWAGWSLLERVTAVKIFECSFAARQKPVDRMTFADEHGITLATLDHGTIIFGD